MINAYRKEIFNMKLMKKVTAGIAMAALCCTMVVPMVATAGNGTGACPGHVFRERQIATRVLSAELFVHEYEYVKSGEVIRGTCRVQLIENDFERTCYECGYQDVISREAEQHMNPNCDTRQ